jgi:hypothetical protein
LPHSAALASHASAQTRQTAAASDDPRLMKPEHVQHNAAQSRQVRTQAAISGWSMQASLQCSQARAQAVHASMHFWNFSWSMIFPRRFDFTS